jgi:hypothetical protein
VWTAMQPRGVRARILPTGIWWSAATFTPTSSIYRIVRAASSRPPSQSDICQTFAEVMTSTCKWVTGSTTDMQMLGAPNGPSQIVMNGVLPATPPYTDNVLEQRYVSKPLHSISRWYRTLQTFLELGLMLHTKTGSY